MKKTVKIAIIGTGNISSIYCTVTRQFGLLELVACSDKIMDRARATAKKFEIPNVYTVEELLKDPEIEIVLNLTTPDAHGEVAKSVLEGGKSVYNEKPLALTREEAFTMLRIANSNSLRIGCAPDTFLGAGLQTCRKLIDEGAIGQPIAATAFMLCHGHESWHPDPEFYYLRGGGPMFDMGPYYLTALVSLLGPVKRVTGSTKISFAERTITSQPKYGKKVIVEVPTHVAGILDFENGVIATIVTSFDVWSHQVPRIEIYGSEGTLSVPDPNGFGGPVHLRKAGSETWDDVNLVRGYPENSRGLGVADMATAIRSGRKHRANEKMAYHVLDIMHAIHDSSNENVSIHLKSTCTRPDPLRMDLPFGILDE